MKNLKSKLPDENKIRERAKQKGIRLPLFPTTMHDYGTGKTQYYFRDNWYDTIQEYWNAVVKHYKL